MRTPPGTVLFDLGGVLLDWDPRHLYRQLLPDDDAVASHTARFPHHRELLAAYPQRFLESLAGEVPGTAEVVRDLHRQGTRLLALTNWSAETFPAARERFDVLGLFEDVVVSGVEKVAKPDPAVFRLVLDRFDLDPAGTVFVDDSPANVAAAEDAGLVAHRFVDAGTLRAALRALGVLPAPAARSGTDGP